MREWKTWIAGVSVPTIRFRDCSTVHWCSLYRYWDAKGVLLYVGITDNPWGRHQAHVKHAEWWQYAADRTEEWFTTRRAAEAAERRAYTHEDAIFNKNGVPWEEQLRRRHRYRTNYYTNLSPTERVAV